MSAPSIYSPSQTERYIRCPRLWDYSRRWEPIGGKWVEKLIGISIHAGLAAFYGTQGAADHERAAHDTLRDEWPQDAETEISKEAALTYVTKGLKKALSLQLGWGLGKRGTVVVAVESILGEEGSRVDLAFKDASGVTVVDWKYTHHATEWVIQKRLQDAEVSWQLRHYAWRLFMAGHNVTQAGIALVVGGPTSTAKWASIEITPQLITDWYDSALHVWSDIQACRDGVRYPRPHFGEACLRYGGCPFYDGCHRMFGDESRFHTLYQAKEAK